MCLKAAPEHNVNLVKAYYEQTSLKQPELIEEAARFLNTTRNPGELVEIRCLPQTGQVFAGTFRDMAIAAKTAVALNGKFKGTYFTLNPLLDTETTDRIAASPTTAKDEHVAKRSWLLLDIEGTRPKDSNATDQELERALLYGEHLIGQITEAQPLALLSGNGCHLLYRLDLPNTEEVTQLLRSALRGLAQLYPWDGASLDLKVFNAARISKLPGTLTKKGLHTTERPQRIARVLDWAVRGTLSRTTLEDWAKHDTQPTVERAPQPLPKVKAREVESEWKSKVDPFERATLWIEKRDPAITGTGSRDNWTYETCGYMVRGFALPLNEALEALESWNQRCVPPWPLEQLEKKCLHALKYGKQPFGEMLWQAPKKRHVPDSAINNFAQTDLGNAELVLKVYGNRLVFNKTLDRWLLWSGKHWGEDKANRLYSWVNKSARLRREAADLIEDEDVRKTALTHARRSESYRSRQATIEQMKAFTPWVKVSDAFDTDLWALTVDNGTIDLQTGRIRPHNPQEYVTKTSSITYDPAAECPLWESYLNTAMKGDTALIDYVQRAIGYSLTGQTSEHAVFICHGHGRNGKSLFLGVLGQLLGDYATSTPSATFTERESDNVNNAIACLDGARLVQCSETNQGFRLDEACIKSLSGEDIVTARFLYREFFKFRPRFKVWLASNYKPIISGTDLGIWRRIKLIPWTHEIPLEQVDPVLGRKLEAELPGILAWAVRGCLKWQQEGLKEPLAIKAAIAEYQSESDTVGGYLRECCTTEHAFATEKLSVLYAGYLQWAREQGLTKPIAKKSLSRKLKEKGFKCEEQGRFHQVWFTGLKVIAMPDGASRFDQDTHQAIEGFTL